MNRPAPPSAVQTGTHDNQAIKQVGAEPLAHGVGVQAWRITSCKRPIIGDKQLERYQAELGGVLTVPEILFGNSHLTLHHAPSGERLPADWQRAAPPRSAVSGNPRSHPACDPPPPPAGVAIRFLALDALKAWQQENLPPLKVQGASAWQRAREKEIRNQNALILEYDWTFTSPYTGTIVPGYSGAGAAAAADGAEGAPAAAQGGGPPAGAADGDACAEGGSGAGSGGCGAAAAGLGITTSMGAVDLEAATAAAAAATAAAPQQQTGPSPSGSPARAPGGPGPLWWQPTSQQIDRSMLMQREPILYYDEVTLYESELDDNGTCQLVAKVRAGQGGLIPGWQGRWGGWGRGARSAARGRRAPFRESKCWGSCCSAACHQMGGGLLARLMPELSWPGGPAWAGLA
jgi:hypothetical protein